MSFLRIPLGIFTLFCIFCFSEVASKKVCYHAKTCIHSAKEKCGVDKKGHVRRFLDSCDILEYNCLKGSEYVKTEFSKCNHLPPIENNEKAHPGKYAVTNDYWCWRSKYCRTFGDPICGYDGRLLVKIKFKSECNLIKHNCRTKNDFRVIPDKKCKTFKPRKRKSTTTATTNEILFITVE